MGAIIVMDLGLVHTCQLEELFPNLECNAFEVCTAEEANERVPVD
jgi:hypothetical protein